MNAVCLGQLLNVAVLRKQRHRRHGLARQHHLQIFCQGEPGSLHLAGSIFAAQLGVLHKALHHGLHGAQHQSGARKAHHFKSTHRLVQLLACNAKLAGIYRGQIRAAGQIGIPHKAFERLGSTIQGFAQLVQHPSQGPQVAKTEIKVGACRISVSVGHG